MARTRPGAAKGVAAGMAAAAAGVLSWSLFESQWIEFVELDVPIRGLPVELDGFRILHLSDFHLGALSLNGRAVAHALEWVDEREFDVVAITGDLLSRRRGEKTLERAVARLRARHGIYAVLGNHDVAETRDPFSQSGDLSGLEERGALLLGDDARSLDVDGVRVQVVGVDPNAFLEGRARPHELADPDVGFRLLLSHFPEVVDRLPPGAFDLVLAGHLHGGQICAPTPWGKIHLSHVRGDYWEGLFATPTATLYVSRGLGTTFVPFRLFARPEVTALTLRASTSASTASSTRQD